MSQDDFIRTALRVPPDLHKALHEASDKAARSFNAEIVARLQASFEGGDIAELAPLLARLESALSHSEVAYEAMRKLGSAVAMYAQMANRDLPESSEFKLRKGDAMSEIVALVADEDIRKTIWKAEPFGASAQAAAELQELLRQAKLVK